MQRWKLVWLIIGVFCLFSSISVSFASASAVQTSYAINDQCEVTLDSIDKVRTGSNAELPLKGWQAVESLPDLWEHSWPNYSGGAWYRLIWDWRCKDNARLAEPITFSIRYINTAGAVYLNGDMLWSDRHLTEPLSKSWNMPRYWIMPVSGLKQHGNEILIYVNGYAVQSAGIGKVSFDNTVKAEAIQQDRVWRTRTLFQINVVLSGTLGFICFIFWLFRRSESSFGWFALSSLLWIIFIANILATETYFFSNVIDASRFNLSIFILYILSFCTYLLRFIQVKNVVFERGVLLLSACVILSICTVSLNMMKPLFDMVFLLYCGLFLAVSIFMCWKAVKSKRSDYISLALCIILVLGCAAFDVHMAFNGLGREMTPLSPYTSPLITLFIAVLLGARLNQNIKKIERFNDELSTKVQQVSLDLSTSLNDKHRLELSNARLQERMKLSHDLHDGLGASIVRSMIIVDQCEQTIPNQQFLSMLKLLRDDLRQIIDSGSAAVDKIPETPMLWAAPVRHRFSQLMDEMDIHAVWVFAPKWDIEPTSLQCLNLIRVLEESLTNILKHSQASEVRVTMAYSSPQILNLTIWDNGIGFDVDCVTQYGMSIGMRSMKTRMERMGGVLEIFSEKGNTEIHVQLPLKSS